MNDTVINRDEYVIVAAAKATEVNLAPAAAEPTPAEPTYEFSFKVRITMEKALALKDFCTENGIELQRIL